MHTDRDFFLYVNNGVRIEEMYLHSAFLYVNYTQITQYVKQTHIFSVYLSMLDFQNI
jgi:hypothetical protein